MNKLWQTNRMFYIAAALFLACITAAWFFSRPMFFILLAGFALYILLSMLEYSRRLKRLKSVLQMIGRQLSGPQSEAISNLKVPVLVSDEGGEILWVSRAFCSAVNQGYGYLGKNTADIFSAAVKEALLVSGEAELLFDNKIFTVYLSSVTEEKTTYNLYYFFDQTALKQTALEYKNSRPVVGFLMLDGFDELFKNMRDSEASAFKSLVQQQIEKWIGATTGFLRKIASDRFMFVIEERHYKTFAEENFSVLKQIRELKLGTMEKATVSVGIGRGGKSLADNALLANQALDMALGRGGDQVVVQSPDNRFRFFGGVSGALEKRTKVRTRIMATALKKLIVSSENVLVMGHKYSDLDCLGAAFGICSLARALDKNAHIVLDKGNSLAKPLVLPIDQQFPDCIIEEAAALPLIDKKTLLIVVDVHRPSFLESPRVYEAVENVVVIDHHRKAVDHVPNALIFFHETAVSSTCEMVTELLQYADVPCITKSVAEALLSGIMLDTKHFVLHTGVRTFEAAAYLRNFGADPVLVKRMFADSVDTYKLKAQIVSSAELYGDCAIAVCTHQGPESRIATSQAADELLNVDGVAASFVLFEADGKVCISARSFGEWNVQVIMEALGGGGHRTMSACQMENTTLEGAVKQLCTAIDQCKANQ